MLSEKLTTVTQTPHNSSISQSEAEATKSPQLRNPRLSIVRLLGLTVLYCTFFGAGTLFFGYQVISSDLPDDLVALREPPSRTTQVWSREGDLIGEFFIERRVIVPLEKIPQHVQLAFIAAEDRRFQTHRGFDPLGIARAAYVNFQAERTRQGASTITQQLTRLLLLTNERSYYRKLKELILSVRVENELSKDQILEMYLNRVFLGTAHGVESASQSYFGKSVDELTIAEGALLAGLVQRPSGYAPHKSENLPAAKGRQQYVLERMLEDGVINQEELDAAFREPLALIHREKSLNHVAAPYFVEYVRKWAQKKYGDRLFSGGLNIHTTLSTKAQKSAEAAVRHGLENLARRKNYSGPLGHLSYEEIQTFRQSPPKRWFAVRQSALAGSNRVRAGIAYVGVIADVQRSKSKITIAIGNDEYLLEKDDTARLFKWQRKQNLARTGHRLVGDILSVELGQTQDGQQPQVTLNRSAQAQAALIALNPREGTLEAMVGGYDFTRSHFNRAVQAKRQIGSAMKPFIYATALENGVTHLDKFHDGPITIRTQSGGLWSPKNYNRKYLGNITLRTAIAKSVNTVAIRLAQRVGISKIIKRMRDFGITSHIPRHISVALGTADLNLWEVTGAMAVFANGGKRLPKQAGNAALPPGRFVEYVKSGSGKTVDDFRQDLPTEQIIDESTAYLVADLMGVVVQRGTGRKAQVIGKPAAGKTGTSSNFKDAWFVGFTRNRIAGIWVGRDNSTPLGDEVTGGNTALPIWNEFMVGAYGQIPSAPFDVPPEITFVRANELTGAPLAPGTRHAAWVPFKRGTVPARFTRNIQSSKFGVMRDLFKKTPKVPTRKTWPQ